MIDTFKHSFFPWNKVHPDIRNASIAVFKKHFLKEIYNSLQCLQTCWPKTTS